MAEPAKRRTAKRLFLDCKKPNCFAVYVIEPLGISDDIEVATILAAEGTIIKINPFTARVNKRVCKVVLTFESVDEILK